MTASDDEHQLRAMAAKARKLAAATTDTVTIDRLRRYAEACQDKAAQRRAARPVAEPDLSTASSSRGVPVRAKR